MQYNNLIERARNWIGTPFHPREQIKKLGCDCLGFILGLSQEIDKKTLTPNYYNPFTESEKLLTFMEKNFQRGPLALASILLLKFNNQQYHLALISNLTPLTIIHSSSSLGVVEEVLPHSWKDKIIGFFTWI